MWVEACVALVECGVEDTEREDRRCPGVERLVFLDRDDEDDETEGAPSRRVNDPCKTSPDPRTCTLSGRLRLTGGGSGVKVGLAWCIDCERKERVVEEFELCVEFGDSGVGGIPNEDVRLDAAVAGP